jgi:Tfp pilus assembly protein PilN
MTQVNLLPPELRQRQATQRTTVLAALAGAAALALVLVFSFMQSAQLSSAEADLAAQEDVNARVSAQIAELQKFGDLQTELATKQQLIDQVFRNEVSWSGVLLDVSRVIPSEAYLTNFTGAIATTDTVGQPADATAGLVGSLSFTGNVRGADTLAAWLTRLEQVDGWVNAWANSASETAPFSRIYQFQSGVDLTTAAVTRRGRGGTTP